MRGAKRGSGKIKKMKKLTLNQMEKTQGGFLVWLILGIMAGIVLALAINAANPQTTGGGTETNY